MFGYNTCCILYGRSAGTENSQDERKSGCESYSDSLSALSASYFAYFRLWDDLNIPAPRRVRPNPAFYKLFVPPTYYEAPIKEIFEIKWSPDTKIMTAVDSLYMGKRDSASAAIYQLPDLETWPLPTVGRIIY